MDCGRHPTGSSKFLAGLSCSEPVPVHPPVLFEWDQPLSQRSPPACPQCLWQDLWDTNWQPFPLKHTPTYIHIYIYTCMHTHVNTYTHACTHYRALPKALTSSNKFISDVCTVSSSWPILPGCEGCRGLEEGILGGGQAQWDWDWQLSSG